MASSLVEQTRATALNTVDPILQSATKTLQPAVDATAQVAATTAAAAASAEQAVRPALSAATTAARVVWLPFGQAIALLKEAGVGLSESDDPLDVVVVVLKFVAGTATAAASDALAVVQFAAPLVQEALAPAAEEVARATAPVADQAVRAAGEALSPAAGAMPAQGARPVRARTPQAP